MFYTAITFFRITSMLVLQAAFAAALIGVVSGWFFPFTTDSFIYISTADHWSRGLGLVFSNFFVQPPVPDVLPSILEPPGYPLLIGLLKLAGMDGFSASLFIPRLSFVALPLLYFLVFRYVFSSTAALVAAFVCTFMFPLTQCASMAWTDIPYLCVSLMSLAAVFHIIDKRARVSALFILFAGMLAGSAFLIRYVGVTLIAAIGVGFFACALLGMFPRRDVFKVAVFYGVGVSLAATPFLIRNIMVFGTAQPYQMPPSQISILANGQDYLQSLGQLLFASSSFEWLILLVIVGMLAGTAFWARKLVRRAPLFIIFVLVMLAYFFFYSGLMITYKTVFLAPEEINTRYMIQVGWILMAGIVFGVNSVLRRLRRFHSVEVKPMVGIALAAFMLIQVFPAADAFYTQRQIRALVETAGHYAPALRSLPADYVIVSNVADIVHYVSRRNARMLANYTPYGLASVMGGQRRFVVFLVKGSGFPSPAWDYPRMWERPEGYRAIFSDRDASILIPF